MLVRNIMNWLLPPKRSMSSTMICLAPSLIETIANTAATPIMMPRSVSDERSLFSKIARRPCVMDSKERIHLILYCYRPNGLSARFGGWMSTGVPATTPDSIS